MKREARMAEDEDIDKLGLQKIQRKTYTDITFTQDVENQNFQHAHFSDVGGRGITFKNCDFSYCVLTGAYFPDASFEKCKFTGARLIDCNFHNATFYGCDFKYAQFRGTLINSKEVLSNLPEWENVKRDLMMSHRKNAEGIGDMEAVKRYIRAELDASREHWRKARERKESYYAKKYAGLSAQLRVIMESMFLYFDRVIWGHGEYPFQLVKTTIALLLIFTALVAYQNEIISSSTSIGSIGSNLYSAFLGTVLLFLGFSQPHPNVQISTWLTVAIIVSRYLALGLFVSMIFRRLSRR